MRLRRWTWALAGALAAACAFTSPARADGACGWSGYSYAGLMSAERAHGVAATLSAVALPRVESGHVAAWVGVGGAGAGPHGTDVWLQVGLSAFPSGGSRLYYEFARPGKKPRYVEVESEIAARERHRVAVLEMARRRHWWRVWVDGRPASRPIFLPGSHGAWEPVATAESWDGGIRVCNRYAYRFERVTVATRAGGGWRPLRKAYVLQDRDYRVVRRSPFSFLATLRT